MALSGPASVAFAAGGALPTPPSGVLVTDAAGNIGSASQTLTITGGPPGETGPTGPPGASGPTGPPGASGPTGPPGTTGPTGPTGAGGATGPTGSGGAPGPAGAVGATGPAGGAGAPGAAGPSGPRGAAGATGLTLSSSKLAIKHGKHVLVRVALSNPAKVTVTVLHGKRVVATMIVARAHAGRSVLNWNGRVKRGFAARGAYMVVVTAVTTSGASASVKGTLRIT